MGFSHGQIKLSVMMREGGGGVRGTRKLIFVTP